jgi:hypothetical protein
VEVVPRGPAEQREKLLGDGVERFCLVAGAKPGRVSVEFTLPVVEEKFELDDDGAALQGKLPLGGDDRIEWRLRAAHVDVCVN